MSEKRATKPTTRQRMAPVKNARKLLVRMERLELPRALHPLKPKCTLKALSGTNFLRYQIVPQQQPRRSPSEEHLNPADNLRTSLRAQTYQDRQQRTRSHRTTLSLPSPDGSPQRDLRWCSPLDRTRVEGVQSDAAEPTADEVPH
jgi:hypothetical protein